MKKLLFFVALAALCGTLSAQTTFSAASDHYRITSEVDQAQADLTAKTMEALFGVYNSYFHFDDGKMPAKLNVRVFTAKESFNLYLNKIIGTSREDFVYLHYAAPEKSELVCFVKDDAEEYATSLAHQGFIQFLKAFVSNPPLWLREGFAVFFEQVRYDAAADKAVYKENLAWLETVKGIIADKEKFAAPEALMTISVDGFRADVQSFYPQAWALVSFLVSSDKKDYNRLIWDSVLLLAKDATLEENSAALLARASKWVGKEKLQADFLSYVASKKTFADLVADGIKAYGEKKAAEAEASFVAAIAMNPKNYVPYYYMGLLSYGKKDYAMAEYYYKTSLTMGADAGIANYALGVNAFVDNRFEDAKSYLAEAKTSSPDKYGAKVDELLAKIE